MKYIIFLLCITYILAAEKSPKIIIIGSGAAGLAAASKLVDNGFDIQILEAENRIGGRLYSKRFGDYEVDMGGQWVHGEIDNVSFELAWPLGLIERFTTYNNNNNNNNNNFKMRFFSSSGDPLSPKIEQVLAKSFRENMDDRNETVINSLDVPSIGNYMEWVYEKEFKKHAEITLEMKEALLYSLNLIEMAQEAADSWHDVSAKPEPYTPGDQALNWKNRTYTTIIDILLKRYPHPEEELPVEGKTIKNSKVTKINYKNNCIKVSTANGDEYKADHVIFTPSLGVLKVKYEKMFDPALPFKKINAIKNWGFGHVAKILLLYDNPWWDEKNYSLKVIYWNKADREELENDPERRWLLSVVYFGPLEHKSKVLFTWLDGKYVTDMEKVPQVRFEREIVQLIKRFFGKTYVLTEPKEIIRTMWNTNDNFLGTYSYQSLDALKTNAKPADIAEPILQNEKPVVQFAGEATAKYHSTVHGAIQSGWREADRLIKFYEKNNKSSFLKSLFIKQKH